MPRTDPAPTWPLPTSWKIDFAGNPAARSARFAAPEALFDAATSHRSRQNGGRSAPSHASPSLVGERPDVGDRRSSPRSCGEPLGQAEREVETDEHRTRRSYSTT